VDLSDGRCQHADNLLMWHGDHTLPIDVNNTMSNPHATSLGYASSQQAADLTTHTTLFNHCIFILLIVKNYNDKILTKVLVICFGDN